MSERSALFRKKLEGNPENHLFRFSLSQALFEEGRLAECMDELENCLAAKPDWMIASLVLGKAKKEAGRTEEAAVVFEETVRMAREQNHEGPEEEARALLTECRESKQ